jgi:hypothetical protein
MMNPIQIHRVGPSLASLVNQPHRPCRLYQKHPKVHAPKADLGDIVLNNVFET